MANIKFSAFTQKVDQANVDFLVGYTGTDNVRIAPSTIGQGVYVLKAGDTMTGNLNLDGNTRYLNIRNAATNTVASLSADGSGDGQLILRDSAGTNKVMLYGEVNADQYIANGGKLGINTTSPTDTLTISNDNNLLLGLDAPAGNDAQLRFYSAGNYKSVIYRPASTDDLRFNTVTSGDVLTILQGGNVGIGTNSPDRRFEIESTATAEMCMTGTTGNKIFFRPTLSYSPGGNFGIIVFTPPALVL